MKIVLYNIGYATGLNGSLRQYFLKSWRYLWSSKKALKDISELLANETADIICLLETDVGSLRNRFGSQVTTIANRLKFPHHKSFKKQHPKSLLRFIPLMGKQHDVILSNKRGYCTSHYLNNGSKRLIQEFLINNMSIFVVHLSLLRKKVRKKQLAQIAELLKKCKNPFILCGDFNIYGGLEEIKKFLEENNLHLVKTPPTFPSILPKYNLDLFITSKSVTIKNVGVIDSLASDHLPVWIEIAPGLKKNG